MVYQQVTNNKWFSFWVNWYNKDGWKTESKNDGLFLLHVRYR